MVVEENSLQHYTREGWVLKAVVQEQTFAPIEVHIPGGNDKNTGQWVGDIRKTEYHDVTQTRYLLVQSKDETITGLKTELDSLKKLVLDLRDEKTKLAKELLDKPKLEADLQLAKKDHETVTVGHKMATEQVTKLRQEIKDLSAQFKQLSDHDGAVRQLQALEDWVIRFRSGATHENGPPIGEPPLTSRKTWAERLLEDSE